MMPRRESRRLRRIAARSAVPMFVLSVAFLLCLAVLVVLWVDLPNLSERKVAADGAATSRDHDPSSVAGRLQQVVLLAMMGIWPVFLLESLFHFGTRPWCRATRRYHLFSAAFCLCPALRMFARSPELGNRLWLPVLGWRRGGAELQRRLQRVFSVPMIVIALMIMPVLIIEFFMEAQVNQYAWLRGMLHVGTGTIWFAFAAEFILMVSVAEKKWTYVRDNWLDLAIVLLPLISFLRTLRLVRVTGVARLARAQQLARMARVYRLRATAIKAFRALVLLEFFHRLIGGNPQRRLRRLRAALQEKQREVARLQREIARVESQAAAAAADSAPPANLERPAASPAESTAG